MLQMKRKVGGTELSTDIFIHHHDVAIQAGATSVSKTTCALHCGIQIFPDFPCAHTEVSV